MSLERAEVIHQLLLELHKMVDLLVVLQDLSLAELLKGIAQSNLHHVVFQNVGSCRFLESF